MLLLGESVPEAGEEVASFGSVELSEMCFDGTFPGSAASFSRSLCPSAAGGERMPPPSPPPTLLCPRSFPLCLPSTQQPELKPLNAFDAFLPRHSLPVSIPKPGRACAKSLW